MLSRRLLLLLFFLSGLCSLIFEIGWVRQATLVFGVSIYAYSAVLTAYMGGMAIGGFAIGRWVDRATNPWRLFAGLNGALAILGVGGYLALNASVAIYAEAARSLTPGLSSLTVIRLLLALLALTPAALCIGALWPVAGRIYAVGELAKATSMGWLYAANTAGAVLGALLTALVLIRVLGLRETMLVGGALALLVAALAWRQGRSQPLAASQPAPRLADARPTGVRPSPLQPVHAGQPVVVRRNFVLWAYAFSGLVALGYEVVWARLIALHTVGAIYSFAIMLSVFLTGLLVGSLLSAWLLRHRRPSLTHFGALQLAIGLTAVLALFAFAQLPHFSIEQIFGAYSLPAEIALELLFAFITLFPITMLIGALFPVAAGLYTAGDDAHLGRNLARLTALNTAGSVIGVLLTGFVLTPALGLQHSTLLLATANLAIGVGAIWLATRGRPARRVQLAAGGVVAATLIAALLLPSPRYLGYWQNLADRVLFYREGVETTVAVFAPSESSPKFSSVNGRVEVPTDALSLRAFYLLGHLPAILRPDAQNALMLSFGNGIATGALASHGIPHIDVVELAPEMIAAASVYTRENRNVLANPGVTVHIEDARNYLLQSDQRYDIITTDATHPANSSSWTLFTREFYEGVRGLLADEGVFVQWVPLHSMAIDDYLAILRTFQSVFPHATLWYTGGTHSLLLATPEALTPDSIQPLLERAQQNLALRQELGGPPQIARHWIMNADQLAEFAGAGPLVSDNRAFFLPINAEMEQLIRVIQLAAMRANP